MGLCSQSTMQKLQVIQNKILRSIYDEDIYTSNISIYIELGVRSLNDEIKRTSAKLYQRFRQQLHHSSTRKLRHPHALLLHETKADLTLTDHKCRYGRLPHWSKHYPNQRGPRQLQRSLGREPLATVYKDADLRHTDKSQLRLRRDSISRS
jgi:hypothetical protein